MSNILIIFSLIFIILKFSMQTPVEIENELNNTRQALKDVLNDTSEVVKYESNYTSENFDHTVVMIKNIMIDLISSKEK